MLMRYLGPLAFFLVVPLFAACTTGDAASPTDDRVVITEFGPTRVLLDLVGQLGGEDQATTEDAILGRPGAVVTDEEGYVYVSDERSKSIKVFSPSGDLARVIGRAGEGPGEFQAITTFGIDREGRLVVEDERQRRLTVLGLDGTVLDVLPTDDNQMLWPRSVKALPSGDLLFLYKMPNSRPGGARVEASDYLLHVFSPTLEFTSRFLGKEAYGDMDEPYVDFVSQRNPGSLEVTASGQVWFAPYLYDGFLYRIDDEGQGGTTVIQNSRAAGKTFMVLGAALPPDELPERTQRARSGGAEFSGLVLRESLGLFGLSDGSLVHFSSRRDEYAEVAPVPQLYAEVFSRSAEEFSYGPLAGIDTSTEWFRTSPLPPLRFSWVDESNRLYVVDRYASIVRIYAITLHEDGVSE